MKMALLFSLLLSVPAFAHSFVLGGGPASPDTADGNARAQIQAKKSQGYRELGFGWGDERAPTESIFINADGGITGLDPLAANGVKEFLQALGKEKPKVMAIFNIDSITYNKLAAIAFGTLGNESKFFTSLRWHLKEIPGAQDAGKVILGGDPVNSRGPTQIKYLSELMVASKLYPEVTLDSLDWSPRNAAIATVCRLAHDLIRVKKSNFGQYMQSMGEDLEPYTRYYYRGLTREISNSTATPESSPDMILLKKNLSSLIVLERVAEQGFDASGVGNYNFTDSRVKLCALNSSAGRVWKICK